MNIDLRLINTLLVDGLDISYLEEFVPDLILNIAFCGSVKISHLVMEKNIRSLRHVHSVVDRSIRRSYASENQGSMSAGHPMKAMGKFEVSADVPTVFDRSVGRNFACENRGKRVSSFPIGAMVIFEVSVVRTYCS